MKITGLEINGLKLLAHMSANFIHHLKLIWNALPPHATSVPITLLAEKWLRPKAVLEVTQDENPLWYMIMTPTTAKYDTFLARIDGKFKAAVEEHVAKGKKPNLLGSARDFRDNDVRTVWKMACLKTYLWETVQENNSEARCAELEQMWERGALDHSLKNRVLAMDNGLVPGDIYWVRPVADTETFGSMDVDPAGKLNYDLSNLEKQSLAAQFATWKSQLEFNRNAHKLHVSKVDQWEQHTQDSLLKYRIQRRDAKDAAIEAEADSLYVCQGFPELKAAKSFLEQQCLKFADLAPSRPQEAVARLTWIDMVALGARHSLQLKNLNEHVKDELENHPET